MKTINVLDSDGKIEEYAVNSHNEGLFVRSSDGSWRQLAGTGQFRATSPRSMMRKMKKMFDFQITRMVRGSADGWDES